MPRLDVASPFLQLLLAGEDSLGKDGGLAQFLRTVGALGLGFSDSEAFKFKIGLKKYYVKNINRIWG